MASRLVGIGRGRYGRLFAEEPRCEIVAALRRSGEKRAGVSGARAGATWTASASRATMIPRRFREIAPPSLAPPPGARRSRWRRWTRAATCCEVMPHPPWPDCQRIIDAVHRTGRTYMMAENCILLVPFVSQWKESGVARRLGTTCTPMRHLPSDPRSFSTGSGQGAGGRSAPAHYSPQALTGPIL